MFSMFSSALSLMVVVLGLTMTAAVTGLENGVGGLLAPLDPDFILSQSDPEFETLLLGLLH